MQQRCQASGQRFRTMAPACMPWTTIQGLARNLPETTPHATSRHPTTRPPTAPFTCAVAWAREVLRGIVNGPRIDGKDGVAGSIPAGGSTKPMTSANAGQFRAWDPGRTVALVLLGLGMVWTGAWRMESTSAINRSVLTSPVPRSCLPAAGVLR